MAKFLLLIAVFIIAYLVIKSGWASDPPGRLGAAALTAELLDEGTQSKDALEITKAALRRTPLRRFGEPGEIASVAVFLACEDSSYITGQTIYPDGGRLALNYTVPVKA